MFSREVHRKQEFILFWPNVELFPRILPQHVLYVMFDQYRTFRKLSFSKSNITNVRNQQQPDWTIIILHIVIDIKFSTEFSQEIWFIFAQLLTFFSEFYPSMFRMLYLTNTEPNTLLCVSKHMLFLKLPQNSKYYLHTHTHSQSQCTHTVSLTHTMATINALMSCDIVCIL